MPLGSPHSDSLLFFRIVSGSEDKTIRIWDPKGACQTVLEGHSGGVSCLAWLDDDKEISMSRCTHPIQPLI